MRALRWLLDQLFRIRTRLLVINLVAVLVPVVGIEWARSFERETLRALEQDMRHVAESLRTVAEQNPAPDGAPGIALVGRALEDVARRTRMRVRLLDRAGRVVADSHRQGAPEGPEPEVTFWDERSAPRTHGHASTDPGPLDGRVEVRAARRGQLGTATRVHRRTQHVFLFLTLPVMAKRRVEGIVYVTRSTAPALASLHRLRRQLVQVLAVALGLTALLSLFLAATIAGPLSRLTRAAQRIADGDRSQSLHLARRDETGQLARAFDTLVRQLDSRARYIAEFAANISHEFKTPLSSIRGAAELLADGADADPAARQRFLDNIQGDVGRLDRLVSRMLELSRIEATSIPREPVGLAELARQVAERFDEGAVRVDVDPTVSEALVFGHAAHLESALQALVENAVQHSPAGAEVVVRIAPGSAGELGLSVIDRGPGIDPALRGRIFERFFTTRAAEGGTGLGLAIVATVVKAHGGSVRLAPAADGGACFEVRLPSAERFR